MPTDYPEWDDETCESLGLTGYCFFACKALRELYPAAAVFRLHNETSQYAHIFLKVNGSALDIKGFRPVEEMLKDLGGETLNESEIDWAHAEAFFCHPSFSSPDERDYLMNRFRNHIQANRAIYG